MTPWTSLRDGVLVDPRVAVVVHAELAVEIARDHAIAVDHLAHDVAQAADVDGQQARPGRPSPRPLRRRARARSRATDQRDHQRAERQPDGKFVIGAEEIGRDQPDEQAADRAAQRDIT